MLPFLVFAVSLATSIACGLVALARRELIGARSFAIMMLGETMWTACHLAELVSSGLDAKLLWDGSQWLGVGVATVGSVQFAWEYATGRRARTSQSALLLLPMAAAFALGLCEPIHHWLHPDARIVPGRYFTLLSYTFHSIDWVATAYGLALNALATLILARRLSREHHLYLNQTIAALVAVALPTLLVYGGLGLGISAFGDRDIAFIAFIPAGLIGLLALFRRRLFDIGPVARDAVVEEMDQAVLVVDTKGRLVDFNKAAHALLDVPPDRAIGRPAAEAIGPIWGARPDHPGERAVIRRGDATEVDPRWIEVTRTPLTDPQGRLIGTLLGVRDASAQVSELQEAQRHSASLKAQLEHAQRLESLGRLAGGVAHDFNNILTGIVGNASMIQFAAPAGSEIASMSKEIVRASETAAALTRQLLAFSRKQPGAMVTIALPGAVDRLRAMLSRLLGERIALEVDCPADIWPVTIDPTQFEQVLVNLAVNAKDAMPDGGTLGIVARNVALDAPITAAAGALGPGSYVHLAVRDSGCGIPAEQLERVLEPFFTTKPAGKGTGLGLSVVYGIVQQAGGAIRIASEAGRGTTVELWLPRAESGSDKPLGGPTGVPATSRGERILLVEDQDGVRETVQRSLEKLGYAVTAAGTGVEALALARGAPPFDLLLTDVVMPGMNGPDVAHAMQKLHPGIRVLFVSGYHEQALAERRLAVPGAALLKKPFDAFALAAAVRAALGNV